MKPVGKVKQYALSFLLIASDSFLPVAFPRTILVLIVYEELKLKYL